MVHLLRKFPTFKVNLPNYLVDLQIFTRAMITLLIYAPSNVVRLFNPLKTNLHFKILANTFVMCNKFQYNATIL